MVDFPKMLTGSKMNNLIEGMAVEEPSSTATPRLSCPPLTASRVKRKITSSFLLTWRHIPVCSPAKVTCGDWKLDQTDTDEVSLTVSSVVNHPGYVASTFENDIAVVKVSGSMTCTQGKIWPACLPNAAVNTSLKTKLCPEFIITTKWPFEYLGTYF